MKFQKYQIIGTAAILALSLSACAPQLGSAAPTEPETQIIQPTQAATAATTATQGWDDVVELVNVAGDSTTVYLLADGRYLDRMDRFSRPRPMSTPSLPLSACLPSGPTRFSSARAAAARSC